MELFYLEIRTVHIVSALASGALFLLRAGGFNLLGASWAMATPVRYLGYTIDTVLLTAALMLMTITKQVPFETDWLTVKLLLLGLYVILAWTALGRSSRKLRITSMIAAAALFLFVVSIARAHHPLGIIA